MVKKMQKNDDIITTGQAMALVINAAIGIGLLSLPREVTSEAGPDGWLVLLLGGFFTLMGALAAAAIIRQLDGRTFVDYVCFVFGKPVGLILSILYGIYFIIVLSSVFRTFAEVMKNLALERTPREFLILSLMLVSVYLIYHGLEPTARFMEFILPLWFIPSVVILSLGLYDSDFGEFLPFLQTPLEKLLLGSLSTAMSMAGYEVLLVSAQSVSRHEKISYVMAVSIIVVLAFYALILVTVVTSLGIAETQRAIWPTLAMIRRITVPGKILERLDVVVVIVWVVVVYTTVCAYYFAAALTFTNIFKAREFRSFIALLFPWIYFLAMIPQNVLEAESLAKLGGNMVIATSFAIPLLLLIGGLLKKRVKKDEA